MGSQQLVRSGRAHRERRNAKPAAGTSEKTFWAPLSLILMAVVAYLPALLGVFIWDDVTVVQNSLLESPHGLLKIWFQPAAHALEDHYWPLTYTTFWLERQLWGLWAPGYHATNIALHAANGILLWTVLRRLGLPGAWPAAAVFAVHPVHVESVAWVIERKDVLSGLFYLLGFLTWLRFEEKRTGRLYALTLLSFVAGMLSKSVVVTFPAALLILAFWKRGRIGKQDLAATAPFFVVGLLIALADMAFVRRISSAGSGLELAERVVVAGGAFWFYLGKLLWPHPLVAIYPRWDASLSPLNLLLTVSAVGLPLVLLLAHRRIGRGPAAAMLFFGVTLAPTLGILDYSFLRLAYAADRYQYLASVGPITLLCAGAALGWRRLSDDRWRKALLAGGTLILAALLLLNWKQASLYRDPVEFWSHTVAHNPQAWEAHHQLGLELAGLGRMPEAVAQLRRAVEVKPDYAEAHSNLGVMLAQQGDLEAATSQFEEALRHRPDLDDAQRNLDRARSLLRGEGE